MWAGHVRLRWLMEAALCLVPALLFLRVNGSLQPRVALESVLETGEGTALRQGVYLAVFCSVVLLALRATPLSRWRGLFSLSLLALFAWAGLSVTWAVEPPIAARRYILTLVIAMTVLLLTTFGSPLQVLGRLRQGIVALAIASLAAAVLVPDLAIHQPGDREATIVGDWRGVFYHKNIFGSVLAPGLILVVHQLCAPGGRSRGALWAEAALLLFLLVMSGSKTSLATGLAASFFIWRGMIFTRRRGGFESLFFGLFVCVLALTALALLYLAQSTTPALSPDSFTGRGLIWATLLSLAQEQVWSGFGFQSVFQLGWASPLARNSDLAFLAILPHAHNVLLEMLVSIGLIGLALFVAAIVVVPSRCFLMATSAHGNARFACIGLILFTWLHGLLEVGLLDRDRPDWIVFLFAYGVLRQLPVLEDGE